MVSLNNSDRLLIFIFPISLFVHLWVGRQPIPTTQPKPTPVKITLAQRVEPELEKIESPKALEKPDVLKEEVHPSQVHQEPQKRVQPQVVDLPKSVDFEASLPTLKEFEMEVNEPQQTLPTRDAVREETLTENVPLENSKPVVEQPTPNPPVIQAKVDPFQVPELEALPITEMTFSSSSVQQKSQQPTVVAKEQPIAKKAYQATKPTSDWVPPVGSSQPPQTVPIQKTNFEAVLSQLPELTPLSNVSQKKQSQPVLISESVPKKQDQSHSARVKPRLPQSVPDVSFKQTSSFETQELESINLENLAAASPLAPSVKMQVGEFSKEGLDRKQAISSLKPLSKAKQPAFPNLPPVSSFIDQGFSDVLGAFSLSPVASQASASQSGLVAPFDEARPTPSVSLDGSVPMVSSPVTSVVLPSSETFLMEALDVQTLIPPQPKQSTSEQLTALLNQFLKEQPLERYYPKISKRLKEEGIVLLQFSVDRTGTISQIQIKDSSLYRRLDRAALTFLKKHKTQLTAFLQQSHGDQLPKITSETLELPIQFSLD